MNLAIIIGFHVIVGCTDADDDTFDRELLQKLGEKNARNLHLPLTPRERTMRRMRLYRRKMNARREYFRDTTEAQFQSYDTWGAGGQLELMQAEYGEREEYELPQEILDHQKYLRKRIHLEGYNAAEREYQTNKLLMKSRFLAKKAKPEQFFEQYKYKGDWVFGRNVSIRPSEVFGQSTTTRIPSYYMDKSCLRPCPLIYKFDYGMICAIRWHRPKPTGMHEQRDWFEKTGSSQYPTYFLRNFTNLCEMEVVNCIMLHLDTDSIYSWKAMFRGRCPYGMDDEEAILEKKGPPGNPPPLTDGDKEIELANKWLKGIEKNKNKYSKARVDNSFKNSLNKSRTMKTVATTSAAT